MKRIAFTLTALVSALFLAQGALADVKIKSKQTMAGQSYENTTYIKGKRQRTESMNGMMVNLTQCDLRRGIQLNPNTKTYMVNPYVETTTTTTKTATTTYRDGVVQTGGTVTTTIATKDTGERKQMFGFTARHLIISMETSSSPDACSKTKSRVQMDGWYIDAEFVLDCDFGYQGYNNYANRNGGCRDRFEVKTFGTAKRGFPVYEKMTMFDEKGQETYSMVNEVVELSKVTLDAGRFEIPSDYREVTDPSQMYASMGSPVSSYGDSSFEMPNTGSASGTAQSIRNAAQNIQPNPVELGRKKEGTVRIGLAGVKTGSVGDGITAADLAAAVRNTLIQYLKMPKIEVVTLDARLSSAIADEAKQKECDFVILATVSHKKGGGFGLFGKALGSAVASVGYGHTGSTAGNIAAATAANTVITAANISANVKAKDEVTLDLRLNKADGSTAAAKVFKAKARSDGDDVVTQVVEQAAETVAGAVGR